MSSGNSTNHAFNIAAALGGKPNGLGWICCCPAHADHRPSLNITARDGRLLLYCHAGCSQTAVLNALRRRGLWGSEAGAAQRPHPESAEIRKPEPPRDPLRFWDRALLAYPGSLVRRYLKNRGIVLSDIEAEALRFAPLLWHWPSQTRWPSMVALVKLADGTAITSHVTFLSPDGRDKAPIEKPRLFPAGVSPLRGGLWFGAPDPTREFVVAEGAETVLSAMRIFNAQAGCAALSALGIRRLVLPPEARLVRIFSDHDPEGQGLAAAQDARRRWLGEGRKVAVSIATEIGFDANDVLMRRLKAEAAQ
jgi:hypothetical protein